MNSRAAFLLCFFVTFGSGLAVGTLWTLTVRADRPQEQDRFLGELQLTDAQREQIKGFWTEAMKKAGWQQQREQRDAAQKAREAAIRGLFTPEQAARYDEIQAEYQKASEAIGQQWRTAREEATEKTRAILSDEQRELYDEMRKRRNDGRGRHRGEREPGPPPGGPPPAAPSGEIQAGTGK